MLPIAAPPSTFAAALPSGIGPPQDADGAGNAGAAYAIFSDIARNQVKGKLAKQLKVIQNRLYLLFGELENVLAGMDSYSWHVDEQLSVTALEQWGEAHRLLGDLDIARTRYDEAPGNPAHNRFIPSWRSQSSHPSLSRFQLRK